MKRYEKKENVKKLKKQKNLFWVLISVSYWLVGGASQVQLFFWQWANLNGPWQKKLETMEAPQNRRLYGKMECLVPTPLVHLYRWEGEDFRQNIYWIEVRCYWEHHWGTYWELERNMLGTKEKWKEILPSPHPKLKSKIKALWVHAEPSHWLHEIFIFKTVHHHFWPGLKHFL